MSIYYRDEAITLHHGDSLEVARSLEPGSIDCAVTSPPYFGLRDYGTEGQVGAEESPSEYIANLTEIFREVRNVLSDQGTLWLNLGDSYSTTPTGSPGKTASLTGGKKHRAEASKVRGVGDAPHKNLLGIPWRVALALQADGWILRSDIVWNKTNSMPESVRDRVTNSHEYLFMFSKQPKYFFDHEAIKEDGANGKKRSRRSVWQIPTKPFPGAHFAVFPPALIEPCILAGAPKGGTILDPFSGSGTTGMVALSAGRKYVGIDVNAEYLKLSLDSRLSPRLDFQEGVA